MGSPPPPPPQLPPMGRIARPTRLLPTALHPSRPLHRDPLPPTAPGPVPTPSEPAAQLLLGSLLRLPGPLPGGFLGGHFLRRRPRSILGPHLESWGKGTSPLERVPFRRMPLPWWWKRRNSSTTRLIRISGITRISELSMSWGKRWGKGTLVILAMRKGERGSSRTCLLPSKSSPRLRFCSFLFNDNLFFLLQLRAAANV